MATYILQWEAICEAKKRGLKYYDFWGIMPLATEKLKNQKTEEQELLLSSLVNKLFSFRPQWTNWAGITRFKRGFAPHVAPTCYIGSQDLPYSKFWYFLFNLAHKIKRG
jgi:lipid II:glycine glycyltransferase (peptidoglycan interpeptide bridge formation enzyme)